MFSTDPLVTIAIPTYNRADGYLYDALTSAVAQTYRNLEIIVSDNCSMDNTQQVVRSVTDERVRYIRHPENIGAFNNWNSCVEQAKGVYFLLLHDDDLIDPDYVESCIRACKGDFSRGILRTGTRVIDEHGNIRSETANMVGGYSTTKFFLGWFAAETALYLCSTLYNTDLLRGIGGFRSPTGLFVDAVATARLAPYGRVDVPEVKASFRRHGKNMGSRGRLQDWTEDSLYLLNVISELTPPTDRSTIRLRGGEFLSKKCYSYVPSLAFYKRPFAYYDVYKRFGFSFSPINFIVSTFVKRARARARDLFK
ncbi:MAG: glycosyltransferase family 2 protein [Thiocapsa sp.]|uniref:glycosyltransferase family 2 protein n=1 Tax=Thiocapsa sp. TaxID=2024551 RepID=UPI001BCFB97A|nr:MAG: glycosyltransferase family 2 protein [Thiocapsa sp.]